MVKKKCPVCGAKNSKERMTCMECGTPLTSEQAKTQLSHVSTEAEAQAKTVIEKEPKERIEDEYRDNEKVLYKTRGQASLPNKNPQEASVLVTENHVVIEAEEPIKIPLSHVMSCDIFYQLAPISYSSLQTEEPFYGTATLMFLDDLIKKRKLSLDMAVRDLTPFKNAIDEKIVRKTEEVIQLYDHLLTLGIQAEMLPRHPLQEVGVKTSSRTGFAKRQSNSLGLVKVHGKNIGYVNCVRDVAGSGQYGWEEDYLECLVPLREIPLGMCWAELKSRKRGLLRRKVVDIEWEGGTLANKLNDDSVLKQDLLMAFPLNRSLDITVVPEPIYRCMRIETALHLPSGLLFDCLDRIAALTVKHVVEVNSQPEKVIFETKVEFNPRTKRAEVAICYVTERHVRIESREPLQIPWCMVEECSSYTPTPSFGVGMPTVSHSTVMLRYRDESGSRRKVEFEMPTTDAGSLEMELRNSYPRGITR